LIYEFARKHSGLFEVLTLEGCVTRGNYEDADIEGLPPFGVIQEITKGLKSLPLRMRELKELENFHFGKHLA